jgi:hypothetical protein
VRAPPAPTPAPGKRGTARALLEKLRKGKGAAFRIRSGLPAAIFNHGAAVAPFSRNGTWIVPKRDNQDKRHHRW